MARYSTEKIIIHIILLVSDWWVHTKTLWDEKNQQVSEGTHKECEKA